MKVLFCLFSAVLFSGAYLFYFAGFESLWVAMGTLMASALIFAGLSACVYLIVSGFCNFFKEEF